MHGCSQVLEKCYTDEEIMETKIGQLELTRKVNMLITIVIILFIQITENGKKILTEFFACFDWFFGTKIQINFFQIFDDIMTVKKGQKSSMVLDMNQCNAYSSLGYFTSSSSSLLLQTSSILLILFSMLLI